MWRAIPRAQLLLVLDVVKDEVEGGSLLTEVSDDNDRSADSLLDGAVGVELGEANPLAEGLSVVGQDEGNAALGGQCLDKAGVLIIVDSLGQHDKLASASVKGLDRPKNRRSKLNTVS